MKSPDKIYFPEYCNISFTIKKDGDVEYVRKDTILGWVKTKLSHLQEDFDVYTGQRLILRELIEKIESL